MPELNGYHHTQLTVTDVVASGEWYQRIFGFEPLLREPPGERQRFVMRFPGSGQTFGLIQHEQGGVAFEPYNVGIDHLAFAVASWESLQAWAQVFEDNGIEYTGPLEAPFGGMLHFKDPDGIALALFWEPPVPPGAMMSSAD